MLSPKEKEEAKSLLSDTRTYLRIDCSLESQNRVIISY